MYNSNGLFIGGFCKQFVGIVFRLKVFNVKFITLAFLKSGFRSKYSRALKD
jgi:hypothetical protein